MDDSRNELVLRLIETNIAKYGYHVQMVSHGPTPRWAYTIGVTATLGIELIFAGGLYYCAEEAKAIIEHVVGRLSSGREHVSEVFKVATLGHFSLRKVHPSWTRKLLLGALDFYKKQEIDVLQIVPDQGHWTVDVPDLSVAIHPGVEPAWQWDSTSWHFTAPLDAVAVTDLAALRGQRITEAVRWEDDQWEMFADAGPDVRQEDVRVVPLGVFLAVDPSIEAVVRLGIGQALWRNASELGWHRWGTS